MYDIDQIEILRGPQGLLRGISAPAGSITLRTRRPNFDEIEGFAQVTATNRSSYNVQMGTSLPINDRLAIRVAGTSNVSFCRSNGRLAESPDCGLTANSELRFPAGDYTPFVRGLLTYRPGFYSERVQYDYRSREQVNLFVGLRGPDSQWELIGFVRNPLNQKRISNIAGGQGQVQALLGSTFSSGYRSVNVTTPREFGITGSVKW